MSGLVAFKDFVIVPKVLEAEFILKVVNGYFDTTILGMRAAEPTHLTNEIKISDEMVDMLNQIVGESIHEDEPAHCSDVDEFGYYLHDIVLVMERLKLSYQLDDDRSWHNLPIVGVW